MARHFADLIVKHVKTEDKSFLLFHSARTAIAVSNFKLAEYMIQLNNEESSYDLLTKIATNHVRMKNFEEAIRITQLLGFPRYYISTILNMILTDLLDQLPLDLPSQII